MVRYWCRRATVPEQDTADLVQEVFQTVAKSIHWFSHEGESSSFRGWLRTITHSRAIDWHRRNAGKPRATGGSTAQVFFAGQPFDKDCHQASGDDSEIENQLTQQLYAQALQIIKGSFRERTWKAFTRVVIDGQSPQDVGRELSMKPVSVRVAKSRVLHRLRAELGELDDKVGLTRSSSDDPIESKPS